MTRFLIPAAACLTLAGVAAGAYFLLSAPRFAFSSVRVTGNETVSEAEIRALTQEFLRQSAFGLFHRSNRFLFDADGLRTHLETAFAFDGLGTAVEGNTLTVQVDEKSSELIWETDGRSFFVDGSGSVIRPLSTEEVDLLASPDPEPEVLLETVTNEQGETMEIQRLGPEPELPRIKRLPRFIDVNGTQTRVGQAVLTGEEVENILRFHALLEKEGIAFSKTRIDRLAGKWMSVGTDEGFEILFDPTGDIGAQVENLRLTLRDEVPDRSVLEYVDLRFGDHVYFK